MHPHHVWRPQPSGQNSLTLRQVDVVVHDQIRPQDHLCCHVRGESGPTPVATVKPIISFPVCASRSSGTAIQEGDDAIETDAIRNCRQRRNTAARDLSDTAKATSQPGGPKPHVLLPFCHALLLHPRKQRNRPGEATESSPRIGDLLIGVGTADWVRPPVPPNRTCGSLASGSRLTTSNQQPTTIIYHPILPPPASRTWLVPLQRVPWPFVRF